MSLDNHLSRRTVTGTFKQPTWSWRATICFCLVLLRMGFTCAPSVTSRAVVSYTAFPPLPVPCGTGGLSLLHWPWSRLHRTLSGILPCEARTFLTWYNQPRLSVLLVVESIVTYFFRLVYGKFLIFCTFCAFLLRLQYRQEHATYTPAKHPEPFMVSVNKNYVT